jgi:putative iron-dependent peroxidase
VRAVADAARLAAEQPAFTYHDGRDTTGFVDGTANRPLRRAAEVALVPPGRPGAGGSHVLAMRCVHDLDVFDRLSTEDQQRVIGRTKADSVELAPGVKPSTAHIARAETTLDNEEVEIFRRSVPLREREGVRAVLRRLQRRTRPLRPHPRSHVRHGGRRAARPPDRLLAPP